MGLFRKPTKQDFPDLPDNLYFARLAKISNKVGQESGKPYTAWGFEIVQPPFQKRWVWANTQPTVSPKSQAGKILMALGVDLAIVDENFNEQTLIGTFIKVLVETKENEDTGDKFQNVTKLMPILDSEQPLLQQWLTQLKVSGPVKVATSNTPALQQPVLATAPVSLPAAPVAPTVTGFPPLSTVSQPIVVPQPAVVPLPVTAAVPTATKKGDFPF